ncbi:MAG: hypothetical protein ABI165_00675 [Bryobacteraceae bacterium]
MAVNCYVEPVYTLDADLVVIAKYLPALSEHLRERGYAVEAHPHWVNAQPPKSDLRIQFSTDDRCQTFPSRAESRMVFGMSVQVACLEDVTRGQHWACADPQRRLSKRKKDELDLIRLAEVYPELRRLYPEELRKQLERG